MVRDAEPTYGRDPSPGPVRLRWRDAVSGEDVWIDLAGPREFVADLVEQGFEIRLEPRDVPTLSRCVVASG